MNLWQHLLIATAAGVLLNLTPCVLPALPIKLRSIARVVGSGTRQRVLAALALLAGTLTFFGALAIATAALNWTWGTLFQAVWFRAALALLLAGLGLYSLAGRGVQPPQWLYRIQGRGYAEPYFAGLLAAVLSAPCTGPFLGGVMAFALTQAPSTIFALFMAVGVGLALPYLILLARPGLLARIPRSGPWLRRVQQVMGLILLAGAIFFATTVLEQRFGALLWAGWLGVLTFWVFRALLIGPGLGARMVPALVLVVVAISATAIGFDRNDSTRHGLSWQPLTDRALEAARRAGRPVLVEFTADWCINCKVLEQTVYADDAVARAVAATHMRLLRADLTRPDADLDAALRAFGGAGLPFAVILAPDGGIHRRLPNLFTVGTLVAAIHSSIGSAHVQR
ncbi:MAG: thioredoxin family protein [Salinisphaera sp.]|jgi:thiol:disulfide interchange protein|nr:thioredoxin family protein [Salinisphaera sp.]